MDGRKNNKGTVGNKGGRPPKAKEQSLIEKLTPFEPAALKQLEIAVNAGESWAIKLYCAYMYGQPKQQMDIGGDGLTLKFINEAGKDN